MSKYSEQHVEESDYIQLIDSETGNPQEWLRITGKTSDGFVCEDEFGTEHIHMPYAYIADLKLPSEMDYAF